VENKLKEEIHEMKIPREKIQQRIELGVNLAGDKMNHNKNNRYPKWIFNLIASVILIGATLTFGGSYIADAADSLINKVFGSKEELTNNFEGESEESLAGLEQELSFIEEHLTEEEFADLTQLAREQLEIIKQMNLENRNSPNEEEEQRIKEIQEKLQAYVKKAEANK
jgi:cell division protein FtsN